ncbi:hypothetical protein V6N12_074930 [Hibiscus sabdariffa]|uniref:Uncharacterized protein n=1 Tax=Hibiscus sabdariffa TaxID=183260 RepID=A0ABR2AVZ8_9ROSI
MTSKGGLSKRVSPMGLPQLILANLSATMFPLRRESRTSHNSAKRTKQRPMLGKNQISKCRYYCVLLLLSLQYHLGGSPLRHNSSSAIPVLDNTKVIGVIVW